MGIEELSELEILQGILSLMISIIGIIIGTVIILKYFQYKRKELIGVGSTLVIVAISWMASGISFLSFVFYGVLLNETLYIFLAYGLILISILGMAYAIISLIYPESVKKILLTLLIITIVFEVIFVYLLFTNIEAVGTMAGKFDVQGGSISILMLLFTLILSLALRIILIREFSKSDSKKLRWRGRFIFGEITLMIIGAIMDGALPLTSTTLIIARIILVFSLVFLYLGWLLPDRVANWLIKEKG